MPNIGYVTLVLSFMLAVYAFVVSLVGGWQRRPELLLSSRNAALGVAGFLTLSIIVIEYLLITGHYQTEYVYEVSNTAAPLFYRMTALWGGAGRLITILVLAYGLVRRRGNLL
ncbi:hypothetical protein QUF58_03400 [Anaerolineales bacterium HSG24]|nr:hypothetical protein [Anaerolineales bacterium HSG24]